MIEKIDQVIAILKTMQGHLEARDNAAHYVDAQIEVQQYLHCREAGRPIAQAIQKEVAAYKASMGLSVGQNPTTEINKRFGSKAAQTLFFWDYYGCFVHPRNHPVWLITQFENLKRHWSETHE